MEEKKHFETGLVREVNRKQPLKLQENSLLGPFKKTKAQKHGQQKAKPPKTKMTKKHLIAFWQTTPFLVILCFFFKLYSFVSAKLCFAENTIKIVFSAEHSFCVSTDRKTPFRGETPIFVAFGDFVWPQKK